MINVTSLHNVNIVIYTFTHITYRRELGVTLAAFPHHGSHADSVETQHFRLVDEGLPVLSLYANRRHFRLEPSAFICALAQSLQCLLGSSSDAELERVKATLDRSAADVDSICQKQTWYESLDKHIWAECKGSPGYFIVSCECAFPNSDRSTGIFSFCARITGEGVVEAKTSLRIMAAMFVILHEYLEMLPPAFNKKRRIAGID